MNHAIPQGEYCSFLGIKDGFEAFLSFVQDMQDSFPDLDKATEFSLILKSYPYAETTGTLALSRNHRLPWRCTKRF